MQIAEVFSRNWKRLVSALRVFKYPALWDDELLDHPMSQASYREDSLFVFNRNVEFLSDPKFVEAYTKGKNTDSWGGADIRWRTHVACWAADSVRELKGDFVECGVNRGGLSRAVMSYVNFNQLSDKRFFLLDTFNGLAPELLTEEETERLGDKYLGTSYYTECFDEVQRTFASFENVVLIRGTIPDSLTEVATENVCYLSIDLNCAEPEVAALTFFWDKLVSGAVVLLDDYAWASHEVQKRALDEFARSRSVPILTLPTGQGMIIKR
jgi:O-methyltransferase